MVRIRWRCLGSNDGVAVMCGHPGGCGNMENSNTFHIIWYNIAIWYGNISIFLYGTTYSLLKYTYNTVGLRRKSVARRTLKPFCPNPPPPTKNAPRRSPYRLVKVIKVKNSDKMQFHIQCHTKTYQHGNAGIRA